MSVNFPTSLDSQTAYVDFVDTVSASYLNDFSGQIIAIESMLNLLHSTLSTWKVEKDYIDGFLCEQLSATEANVSAGTVNISGTMINISGTTIVTMPTDLRSGESEQSTDFYNIYGYISGTNLTMKLSNIDPDIDFMHPNENGWRFLTGIPNVSGDFLDIKEYKNAVCHPSEAVFAQAPSGALQEIDLSNLVPASVMEISFLCVGVATAANAVQIQINSENASNRVNSEMRHDDILSGEAMAQTLICLMDGTSFWFKGITSAWSGIYMASVKYARSRY